MNKFACRYAVLQLVPYRETGEFANVGVVIVCPNTGYFGFQLQTRKYKRVTDFFDSLPKHVYLNAIQVMRLELMRIAGVVQAAPKNNRADYVRKVFDSLIHPRESLMRFSAARAVITEDPEAELKRQFDHHVDRAFVTPEYVEQTIERRVRTLLEGLDLPQPFKAGKVGDEDIYARFPLIQLRGGQVAKVIKPFNLSQDEPMGIYDHGGTWLQKLRRLRVHGLLPTNVLFAVAGPPESDVKRFTAFTEICRELEAEGVKPVGEHNDASIEEFALS